MSLDFLTDEDPGSQHSSLNDTEKAARWLGNTVSGTLETAQMKTELTRTQIQNIVQRELHGFELNDQGEKNDG